MAGERKPGERKRNPSKAKTKIARLRIEHGVTQEELVEETGLGLRALQDLERGNTPNPKIRHLVVIAAALGVELDAVLEDEWSHPMQLRVGSGRPLKPRRLVEPLKKRPGRFDAG